MHVSHIQLCPEIGPICGYDPPVPYQHDQTLVSNDLVLDAELGLLPHLAIEGIFTLRQTTDRIQFLDLQNQPYVPPVPDFHHRNETIVGPTDPWLMLHFGTNFSDYAVSGRAGVSLPIGYTVPNPFELGREGLPHEHIQYGTGTWDPILGASIDRQFTGYGLSLWTLNRFVFGTNSYGYQSGHKLLVGLTAKTDFGLKQFNFSGGLDVYREMGEHWSGKTELEGNLGRTDFIADLTAAWVFSKPWTVTLGLKIPLYSFVQGEQAYYPGILTLALSM